MNGPRPSTSEVDEFLANMPSAMPIGYVNFIRDHGAVQVDVPGLGSEFVGLWELGQVLELHQAYGLDQFAPGLFAFGTDGSGALWVFDLRDPAAVTVGDVPAIGLSTEEYRPLCASFEDFVSRLAEGTPVPIPLESAQ